MTAKASAAQKAALAMHAKHPAGAQTAKQLSSERANLVKARAALAQKRSPATSVSGVQQFAIMKASVVEKAQRVAAAGIQLRPAGIKPLLGSSLLRAKSSLPGRLSTKKHISGVRAGRKPTGFNRRVRHHIGETRHGWGTSKSHRERKNLAVRKHRVSTGRWRRSRSVSRPR